MQVIILPVSAQKHAEHAYLYSFVITVSSMVTNQFKNVDMEDKFSLYEYGRVAPILLSYWVISMSVWWCIRVQIFFDDRCATVVFLKHGFRGPSVWCWFCIQAYHINNL